MEERSLATEMLQELKAQSKRKDIIIIILIGVILAMIISFFIYENNFETVSDETTTEYSQEADTDGNNSPINQNIGEWYKWLMQDKQKELLEKLQLGEK